MCPCLYLRQETYPQCCSNAFRDLKPRLASCAIRLFGSLLTSDLTLQESRCRGLELFRSVSSPTHILQSLYLPYLH